MKKCVRFRGRMYVFYCCSGFIAVVALLCVSGCATIILSDRDEVAVVADPQRKVLLNTPSGSFPIKGSTTVSLWRSRSNVYASVICESGKREQLILFTHLNVQFWLGNLFSWGGLGWLVDGFGNAGWSYSDPINLAHYCSGRDSKRPRTGFKSEGAATFNYKDANEQVKKLKYNSRCKQGGKKRVAWEVMEYKDKFGDNSGNRALRTKKSLNGSFSNSATSNSKLTVLLAVNSSSEIDIMLFEYGKYSVKDSNNFDVDIKVAGVETELFGRNDSDRITLNESSSEVLHTYLRSDHRIKFFITDGSSTYTFELKSCHGYGYMYKKQAL
ncbi:MAG: hypothetical protein OXC44_08575 [Proteobacteria bacterium]|nr:hypothetical protein [Pseudomonadota bacterium]